MAQHPRFILQNFIDEDTPLISIQSIQEKELTPERIKAFLPEESPRSLGIAGGFSNHGQLIALAIANEPTGVLIILFTNKYKYDRNTGVRIAKAGDSSLNKALQLLQDTILSGGKHLYAFDLGPIALGLFTDHNISIANAVDIQSGCAIADNRDPLKAIKFAIGDKAPVFDSHIVQAFNQIVFENSAEHTKNLALYAWFAQYISSLSDMQSRYESVPRVDIKKFSPAYLNLLAKITRDALRLDQQKPTSTTHSTKTTWNNSSQRLQVGSERFTNRIRSAGNQKVVIAVGTHDQGGYSLSGQSVRVVKAKGKSAHVSVPISLNDKVDLTVTTIGRDAPTAAQRKRNAIILDVLQGNAELIDENPWIQNVWLRADELVWPPTMPGYPVPSTFDSETYTFSRPVNDSQLIAVEKMISQLDDDRIVLVQGPPGTGKTSVIATFVKAAIEDGRTGLWLTAQSNIAVKNIAEKLLDYGFSNFKLLVSSDFHDEWHDHLYTKILDNVIRSSEFGKPGFQAPENCQVILSTLSMLSNARLRSCKFFAAIPVSTLVVDEASQIEIGDYIPVFEGFVSTLCKICFIGDDKQLPPYGQEEIGDLQSIFEVPHLRKLALLLNTQYRMPPQIGDFISDAIYDGQLLSNPLHPITSATIACYFIDVCGGKEKSQGTSYINTLEGDAIVHLARHLESKNKKYRIITPYDSQRALLEESLKTHGLVWQDKCFNVDSFQGNEEDYIIISLVRSKGLGFLSDLRRNNVMLTRCKKGMFICSSHAFLISIGVESLAGRLLSYYGDTAWLGKDDLENV